MRGSDVEGIGVRGLYAEGIRVGGLDGEGIEEQELDVEVIRVLGVISTSLIILMLALEDNLSVSDLRV